MGKFNSSKTRVVPVFNRLYEMGINSNGILDYFFKIGSRLEFASIPINLGDISSNHQRWWGSNERRFKPPKSLLEWLIYNITEDQVLKAGDREDVKSKRLALAKGDPTTINEALEGVQRGKLHRKWYALEGFSAPDVFLVTEHVILVIEGKRTEKNCTTNTKWMSNRSQLLRHMDAATEIAGNRQVYGLLIVEGTEQNPNIPPQHWLEQTDYQVSSEMLQNSLPHRTAKQRQIIANNVLGVVTWQRICTDWGIQWPPG